MNSLDQNKFRWFLCILDVFDIHICLTFKQTYFDYPIHVVKNSSLIKIQVLIFGKNVKTQK